MKELFSFGHFTIYLFGVAIAAGMLAGLFLAGREAKRIDVSEDSVFDIVLFSLLGGIVGARLAFVLFYDPAHYLANPLDVFKINAGGYPFTAVF